MGLMGQMGPMSNAHRSCVRHEAARLGRSLVQLGFPRNPWDGLDESDASGWKKGRGGGWLCGEDPGWEKAELEVCGTVRCRLSRRLGSHERRAWRGRILC